MTGRPRPDWAACLHPHGGARMPSRARAHLRRVSSVAALVALCGACATRGAPSADDTLAAGEETSTTTANLPAPTAAPRLDAVAPTTFSLARGEVPTLILTGTGFVPGSHGTFGMGGNSIRVGRATFDSIPANAAGTVIRFALPLSYTDTTAKGRPSAFTPGDYPLSVVTPKGTSNSLTLTMIL